MYSEIDNIFRFKTIVIEDGQNIGEPGFQYISNCEVFCNEETEVSLWGMCYNIDQTTVINRFNNQIFC